MDSSSASLSSALGTLSSLVVDQRALLGIMHAEVKGLRRDLDVLQRHVAGTPSGDAAFVPSPPIPMTGAVRGGGVASALSLAVNSSPLRIGMEGEGGEEGLPVAIDVDSANAATSIAAATSCPPGWGSPVPCGLEKASTQGVSATAFFFQYITTGVMPPFDSGDKHRAALTASWFEAMAVADELRILRPQASTAAGSKPPTPDEGVQRRIISKLHHLVRLRLRDAFSALPKKTDSSSSSSSEPGSKKRKREVAWPKSLDTPLLLGSLESRIKELKKWGVIIDLGELAEWRRAQESGLGQVNCGKDDEDNEDGGGSGESEDSDTGSGAPLGSGGFWEAPAHLFDFFVGNKGMKK